MTPSIHASAVPPDRLNKILNGHLALERARICRQLLVKRFAVLGVIFGIFSRLWLTMWAMWISVGMCVAVPVVAWVLERGFERRLAQQMRERKS